MIKNYSFRYLLKKIDLYFLKVIDTEKQLI